MTADHWRELRREARDRPRCQEKREQDIKVKKERFVTVMTGAVRERKRITDTVIVRKPAKCNMLLDRQGKCWFCGHVSYKARRYWDGR